MRVNLGCGQAYMEGWTNVDASPDVKADIHLDAAEFVRQYGDQVDEVYMGHVMEHLMPGYAVTLLRLLNERLRPGTVVSVVTPDMRAIFEAYLAGEVDNDKLNASFIYSYVQPSHHVWCYDGDTAGAVPPGGGCAMPSLHRRLSPPYPPVFRGSRSRIAVAVRCSRARGRARGLAARGCRERTRRRRSLRDPSLQSNVGEPPSTSYRTGSRVCAPPSCVNTKRRQAPEARLADKLGCGNLPRQTDVPACTSSPAARNLSPSNRCPCRPVPKRATSGYAGRADRVVRAPPC